MAVQPGRSSSEEIPDLHTQLECLLDEVWRDEKGWRFDDRLNNALGIRRDQRPNGSTRR